MTTTTGSALRHVRGSGLALASFGVNGAVYGTLLTRFPEIADRVRAGEAVFGLVLFAGAVGGLVGAGVVPFVVRRLGDTHAAALVGAAFALLAVAVAWAPTVPLLAVAFVVLEILDGGHDVAMNALAVRVQQRAATPLLGRAHAVCGLALALATVAGAGATAVCVPLLWHVAAVAVVLVALQATAWRRADRRESGDAGRGDGDGFEVVALLPTEDGRA